MPTDGPQVSGLHKQSPNGAVPNTGIPSQFAVLHSSELCRAASPDEGAKNNNDRRLPGHPHSVLTWCPGKAAHVKEVLPQMERHAAEPAATGRHLPDDLPRVRLVTVPLDCVVISAGKGTSDAVNMSPIFIHGS